jgi:gas vesicle protein
VRRKTEVLSEGTVEQDTKKYATYAGYFIAGTAIGAALGVLFAPKAGKETREDMSAWLKERREKSRKSYLAMKEALESGTKNFRAKAKELSGV